MYITRLYNKATGKEVAFIKSVALALDCVNLSWSAYPDAITTVDINGIKVERKGFDPVEYGFEPIRVIESVERL